MSDLKVTDWFAAVGQNVHPPEADIYLIGAGLRTPHDLTCEAIAAITRCELLFALPPFTIPGVDLPPMVDLRELYSTTRQRSETYQTMGDLVLEAAEAGRTVGLMTSGSVMLGVRAAHAILAAAPQRGLQTHVAGGVSFLERTFSVLNIEPFDGLLVWDATDFLRLRATPPTAANLLLAQPAFVNVDTARKSKEDGTDLTELRDHLLSFYEADQPACFVRTASDTCSERVEWTVLRDLRQSPADLSSLFLPYRRELRRAASG